MKRESKQRSAKCRRCKTSAPIERDRTGQQVFGLHSDGRSRCPGVGEFVAARRNRRRRLAYICE